ncbi:Transforming growth factor beta regulator 1 [Armadillidium nasatum]|uniref:Transforming growth factor beta regulator 1 n=1 Tax=Armadillidium nasatum TaxID=96803 RepID=A0A5N5SW50_9CRUS|nr:Transforming growth factor beta regulator 1 [Armadillidium nasatum]
MDDLEKLSKNNETYSAQKRKHLVSSLGQERGVKSRGVCLPAAIADGLARHHAHEQLIYKQKLRKLKKFIRNIVLMLPDFDEGDKSNCSSNNNNNNGSNPRSKSRWKKGAKVKRKCPPIPLDSSGRPIFPLHLGRLTIHSLGDIVGDKEGYHTESMIYPVGFCSSRMYASLKNPQNQSLYTCTIKEGSNKPRFDIICDEDEVAFYGNSPSDCHSQILQKINMILGIDLLPTSLGSTEAEERGLRFFGLSHPSVHNMIQACPGARKCGKYKWIQFEVCRSEAEAEGVLEPDREASICHETLLRNIRFASSHMGGGS